MAITTKRKIEDDHPYSTPPPPIFYSHLYVAASLSLHFLRASECDKDGVHYGFAALLFLQTYFSAKHKKAKRFLTTKGGGTTEHKGTVNRSIAATSYPLAKKTFI